MKVAIYVQHLLGTGHLVRMQALASALHSAGHHVLLVSGGRAESQEGYSLVQLPVVKTQPGDFLTLLDESGTPVDDAFKDARAKLLLQAVEEFTPDLLVLETWPFGRRQLGFEIKPMVEKLQRLVHPPLLVSSIRDVLQQRQEKRRRETLEYINRWFSLVLVHGAESLTPLAQSFPEASSIACPVAYSGYLSKIYPMSETADNYGAGEVLVSAGGGATGARLLQIAAGAAALDAVPWRLMAGPNLPQSAFDTLVQKQGKHLIVERNRPNFRTMLENCSASVSQFGYNTATDLLQAGCPAVVVPYAEDGETEQAQRAACFADLDLVVPLEQTALTPSSLIEAVNAARRMHHQKAPPKVNNIAPDLDGSVQSVKILEQLFQSAAAKS